MHEKHAKTILLAGLILACLAPIPGWAQLADVTIRVDGAGSPNGTIEVSLFNASDTFMKEPFLQMSGPVAADGAYEATFAAVPIGEYAAVAVHDENSNGKLDNGLLGFGGEGYGFSNNARPMLGWPEFRDASFEVGGDTRIVIELD